MGRIVANARMAGVIAAALLMAVPSTAAADQPISHSGSMGAHFLNDSQEYPGVTCRYDDDQNMDRVRVRPPAVFARDRTSARDSQWVGWRAELQYRPEDGSWSTVQQSTVVKARAWDDTAAAFAQRTVSVARPRGSGSWRVVIRMLWYAPGTSTVRQGIARHRVTFARYPLAEPGTTDLCPAGIL
jgi:hypothetical protein